MPSESIVTYVAFVGHQLIARGSLEAVAVASKRALDAGTDQRIALFDDSTGFRVDVDLSGSEAVMLRRLRSHPLMAPTPAAVDAEQRRGPGRPRLGVVSREVSLLPRHWTWLAEQPGGASAAIRRLVDVARKEDTGPAVERRAVEAAHRFLWDIAGDLPGFEEATRALFAHDYETLRARIAHWPSAIREQLDHYLSTAGVRGRRAPATAVADASGAVKLDSKRSTDDDSLEVELL